LRQNQGHRLAGLAEAVGGRRPGLLDAALLDRIDPDARHEHFDQAPLLLPGDRRVEPFPELRQECLGGTDGLAD
jgi:hypothetical protein